MAENGGHFDIRGMRVNQFFPVFYAMRPEMKGTCKFVKCTILSRNFNKSKRLLNDDHIIYELLQNKGGAEPPGILRANVGCKRLASYPKSEISSFSKRRRIYL